MSRGLFLDRDIDRLRQQSARFPPFLSRRATAAAIEEFDPATKRLLIEVFGEASEMLEAYECAKLGEAGSVVNLPDEAQESGA